MADHLQGWNAMMVFHGGWLKLLKLTLVAMLVQEMLVFDIPAKPLMAVLKICCGFP